MMGMLSCWTVSGNRGVMPLTVDRHPQVDSIEDTTQQQLQALHAGEVLQEAAVRALSKRKLLLPKRWTSFQLIRGPKFALQRLELPTDLTTDMLARLKFLWLSQNFAHLPSQL